MKMVKIYVSVIALFLLSVGLFIATFFYLDSSSHRSYEYVVAQDGRDIGTITVDRFVTEDRIVYKSRHEAPLAAFYTESSSRLDLDRKYRLISYIREAVNGRSTDLAVLEMSVGTLTYLARRGPRFNYVDNIPAKKDVFVFEEESPMTYMPIIENYDFSKGRSQGFDGVTCPESPDAPMPYLAALPPISRFVTMTSIKDEYLKVDSRKIKTENLILKIRNYPKGAVWVAKSDRAIIKIDLPARGITITRAFRPRSIVARPSTVQDPRYISHEIAIKAAGTELSGIFTSPTKAGTFPSVLLAGGSFPGSSDLGGMFESIADDLSKNGYCVLRFDRRGIGLSKGDPAASTSADASVDISAALDALRAQPSVDPDRIFIISHADAAGDAMRLGTDRSYIKGLILMTPAPPPAHGRGNAIEATTRMSAELNWPDSYRDLVLRSVRTTRDKAEETPGDWATLSGRRIYIKAIREDPPDLFADASKVRAPALILQGRSGLELSPESSGELDQAFIKSGNERHILKYYPDLGYFFGKPLNDGTHRIRYSADERVLKDIREWLDKTLAEDPAVPEDKKAVMEGPKVAAEEKKSAEAAPTVIKPPAGT